MIMLVSARVRHYAHLLTRVLGTVQPKRCTSGGEGWGGPHSTSSPSSSLYPAHVLRARCDTLFSMAVRFYTALKPAQLSTSLWWTTAAMQISAEGIRFLPGRDIHDDVLQS
jgi:hypothetical protein